MLEFEKTYPVVRAYFNARQDFPNIWSLDDGDQANEMNVPFIISQGVSVWKYNGQKKNPDTPVAWVEFTSARIHRIDESEEVFIENSSD